MTIPDIQFTGTDLVTTDGELLARPGKDGDLQPTDRFSEVLATYADNQAKAQLAAMDMTEITNRAKQIPEYREAQVRYEIAMAACKSIESGLSEAFAGRAPGTKVSIDTGGVLVTAGKARETWKLAHSASWYAGVGVRDQLARFIAPYVQNVHPPSATQIATAVMAWLDPQPTVGDVPAVKLTVRGPGK